MNFLFPAFIAAMAALAIPIIIHLFYFRRFKKIYFSNVRFLREIKEERASRNKLKHYLVLLSRLLAIALLVLAFMQPFLPKNESQIVQGNKAVSIYIDNSFSMNAKSDDVSLFEKARYRAREIADAYGPEDRFQILSNDFEGKHQRLLTKEEFTAYLDNLSVSPTTRPLADVVERQKQALENDNAQQKNIFLISDFQKNIAYFDNDTSYKTYLIPLQAIEQQNVYIDSVWFEQPVLLVNESNKLIARVVNNSDKDISASRMTLQINGQVKSLNDFSVTAKQTITDTLTFAATESGWNRCEVSLVDEPITFDDTYHFSFEVAVQTAVLAISPNGQTPYLTALMRQAGAFKFDNQALGQLDYAKLSTYGLIILNNLRDVPSGLTSALQQFVEDGGSVMIFPDAQATIESYNALLKTLHVNTYTSPSLTRREVGRINIEQEIFKNVFEKNPADGNVDLPYATNSFGMTSFSNTGEEVLMSFKDGGSCISKYSVGSGKVYVSAVPLDLKASNLAAHAVFVPLIHKAAVVSAKNGKLAYTIGKNDNIEVTANVTDKESVMKLRGMEKEFIPGQKITGNKVWLSMGGQIKEAGIYDLFMDETKPLSALAFNYDRRESVLDYYALPELKAKYNAPNISFIEGNNVTLDVQQIDKGIPLWKWCLALALLCLLIEMLLLRLWR